MKLESRVKVADNLVVATFDSGIGLEFDLNDLDTYYDYPSSITICLTKEETKILIEHLRYFLSLDESE